MERGVINMDTSRRQWSPAVPGDEEAEPTLCRQLTVDNPSGKQVLPLGLSLEQTMEVGRAPGLSLASNLLAVTQACGFITRQQTLADQPARRSRRGRV